MFTGIVTGMGRVRELTPIGAGTDMRLVIGSPWTDTAAIPIGASVACAGCCLTAIAVGPAGRSRASWRSILSEASRSSASRNCT